MVVVKLQFSDEGYQSFENVSMAQNKSLNPKKEKTNREKRLNVTTTENASN